MIRKLSLLLISIFICLHSFGQMTSNEAHPLYQIDKELKTGNKKALFEIAPYFDSKIELVERFAYNHISANNESEVAKRIVEVNSIFTDTEIIIDENTSSQDFLKFLNANLQNIVYSEYANAFLITPLEKRSVKIRFREITDEKKLILIDEYQSILSSLENQEIETLIKSKDSKALFIIASELFKERDWLNTFSYGSKTGEYVKLLQILTNFEIEVEGDFNKMTWHIEEEFYPMAALNLLSYFSANYTKFKWNKEKNIFENNDIEILTIGKESSLFQLLGSENDSIAIDAFIQLTTCRQQQVIDLANEYESDRIDINNSLPTFPCMFLKQIVVLTDYCKENNFDFYGTEELRLNIEKLKSTLSFQERYELENLLIDNLSLNDITSFEYWCLIYESNFQLTHSAGRILDKFYSKNWVELVSTSKYLDLYLLKSQLFDKLGIIGICNNYLVKFTGSSESVKNILNNHSSAYHIIKGQLEKAQTFANKSISYKIKDKKEWRGNRDTVIYDISSRIDELLLSVNDSSETQNELIEILSMINYNQIDTAISAIENYHFKYNCQKYSFVDRDFGLEIVGDLTEDSIRNEFIKIYSNNSEYELYSYYLDLSSIDYKSKNNELDYDKIYEVLKYDVVTAFVGGGGGDQDYLTYSIIKLLELTFNTTLDYPKKLCRSRNMYGCNSRDRAIEWRKYLIDNKLLRKEHNEPVSFTYR